jgi:thioredoxin-like negative regulator of GroEL
LLDQARDGDAEARDRVRELMVALFEELGQDHELSTRYRKQLATALY